MKPRWDEWDETDDRGRSPLPFVLLVVVMTVVVAAGWIKATLWVLGY